MQIVVRVRTLTTYVFGIVENFVAELYAGTRGIPSGFFIILVVLVEILSKDVVGRVCNCIPVLSVLLHPRSVQCRKNGDAVAGAYESKYDAIVIIWVAGASTCDIIRERVIDAVKFDLDLRDFGGQYINDNARHL